MSTSQINSNRAVKEKWHADTKTALFSPLWAKYEPSSGTLPLPSSLRKCRWKLASLNRPSMTTCIKRSDIWPNHASLTKKRLRRSARWYRSELTSLPAFWVTHVKPKIFSESSRRWHRFPKSNSVWSLSRCWRRTCGTIWRSLPMSTRRISM